MSTILSFLRFYRTFRDATVSTCVDARQRTCAVKEECGSSDIFPSCKGWQQFGFRMCTHLNKLPSKGAEFRIRMTRWKSYQERQHSLSIKFICISSRHLLAHEKPNNEFSLEPSLMTAASLIILTVSASKTPMRSIATKICLVC